MKRLLLICCVLWSLLGCSHDALMIVSQSIMPAWDVGMAFKPLVQIQDEKK